MDYNEIIKQIQTTDSNFGSVVDAAQKVMLREVLTLTKDLELSNGKILPTVGNLKKIANIKSKLNKAVLSKEYLSGVKDLLSSFEDIQQAQIGYFKSISENNPTQQKYDLVRGMAIENTAAQLTESGLDANVTNKLKDMLLRAVTSGVRYSDLVGEVGEFLTNTEKSPGALSRYAKTYTTTAMNQFAGQTNKLMTEDADFEWYRYTGSDIETTREFCDKMTDKDYFHKSEIPELLKGHIDGHKCEIYEKTGLPKGMIEGTNKENFIVNCGGWNCGHKIVPVLTFTVPKNLRDKFLKKEINDEEDDWTKDFDKVLEDAYNSPNDEDEINEKLEEEYKTMGFSKKWAPTAKIAIQKLQSEIKENEATIELWSNKSYKTASGKTIVVGANSNDYEIKNIKVDTINDNRRANRIKGAKLSLKENIADLERLGIIYKSKYLLYK